MRKLFYSLLFIGCLALTSCSNNAVISISETNSVGNSMFNYLNRSHTTSQGEWIFFNDYENDSGIYAQKKNSNEKILLVSEVQPGSEISVVGNELYYKFDDKLMKYDIKTGEARVAVDEPVFYFIVVEDLIYYTLELPEDQVVGTQKIYVIATNGMNKKLIASNVRSDQFAYYNENIYYVDAEDQFISISPENLHPIVLGKDVNPISCFIDGEFYLFSTNPYPKYRMVSYNVANNNWKTLIQEDKLIIRSIFFDENTILYATLGESENGLKEIDKTYKYTISTNSSTITDIDVYDMDYVNIIGGVHYYYSDPLERSKRETY